MKLRTLKMTDDQWGKLRDEAARLTLERGEQVSVSDVIREACASYVERNEKKRAAK